MIDLEASVLRKARESAQLKEQFFRENAPRIVDACRAIARAFDRGARLFAMGNGGSACDAAHLALEHMHPVIERRPALPAIALGAGAPLLTAIGNDHDLSLAFARELRLLARRGDVAVALSTSGQSQAVLRALQAAREIGMLTIGFTGKDGGRMPPLCDHCFVVPSFSIHRIQETHETLLHVLWDTVHVIRGEEDTIG